MISLEIRDCMKFIAIHISVQNWTAKHAHTTKKNKRIFLFFIIKKITALKRFLSFKRKNLINANEKGPTKVLFYINISLYFVLILIELKF